MGYGAGWRALLKKVYDGLWLGWDMEWYWPLGVCGIGGGGNMKSMIGLDPWLYGPDKGWGDGLELR